MAKIEMKSCPFCGSSNVDPEGWKSRETSGPACDDCGGSAGSALKTREENVAAWNRRVPLKSSNGNFQCTSDFAVLLAGYLTGETSIEEVQQELRDWIKEIEGK